MHMWAYWCHSLQKKAQFVKITIYTGIGFSLLMVLGTPEPGSPGRCKQFSSLQKPLTFVLLWTSLPRTSGYLHLIAIFYMLNSSIISKLIWKGWSLKELSRKAIQPDTSVMSVASGSEFLWRFMFFYCFSPLNGLVSTTKEKNKGTTASFYKGNTFADGNKHRATLFP